MQPQAAAVPALMRRRMPLQAAVLMVATGAAVGAVAAGIVFGLSGGVSPAALPLPKLHGQAIWPAGRRAAPALALPDQDGRRVSIRGLRGHTLILSFMNLHCQACSSAARQLDWTIRRLPAAARPVVLLVGAARGAAVAARATLRRWGVAAGWHWLSGTRAQLSAAAAALGVDLDRCGEPRRLAVYLVDRRGFERTAYLFPFLPAFVAGDLTTLAEGPA
jgi:cytochrome oxidase Cu insertion factor (SCO1/SenC/PrrC family)